MSLIHRLYPLLRPLLFQLDAETAHEWTVKLLKMGHALGMLEGADSDAGPARPPIKVLGLEFPNVVGLAAGMDKSAAAVDAWGALGFGFVEVGTLTPRPQPGNPTPRLFRLIEKEAIINRMGFNNPGIQAAVARLERRQGTGIVGVNIGKNFDTPNENAVDDYVTCLRAAYPVADYIAVNISSPNTKGLRDLQAEEPIRRLVGTLKEEQQRLAARHGDKKPLLVKIAPDLDSTQIDSLARVFTEQQLDGVIATNTTISREAVAGHRLADETGGLSGAPLTTRSTEVISALRAALPASMPIIGVGGILTADHAQAKLDAGAALVQVYTGLVYRGPALVRDIAKLAVPGKN
ncbi:quinone-dependent dihydroorotate dehydrogenase [Verrucomicrobium sp. BvORR106]|uniref:quinone-dependent dihydroorotate dehydrogenase n=1 Tax=Verrucomicrobium sp. BvORR106 TaxID=1403819 RepID=UPI00056E8A34|nr:quinone-dependent dihydroorotate dehydrogenase [Verrucomicrobium sp. BvORR106]